jgi:hypothetical protein
MTEETTLGKIAADAAGAALSGLTGGGIVTILGEGFKLANKIIGYIDDPAKRAKARREYLDSLEAIRSQIQKEQDYEKIDSLLLDLIAAVHNK